MRNKNKNSPSVMMTKKQNENWVSKKGVNATEPYKSVKSYKKKRSKPVGCLVFRNPRTRHVFKALRVVA
jgi:hypothetical protein